MPYPFKHKELQGLMLQHANKDISGILKHACHVLQLTMVYVLPAAISQIVLHSFVILDTIN